MKLTFSPNNYHAWRVKILMDASKIDLSVANNLVDRDPLGLGHLLDGISDNVLSGLLAGSLLGRTPEGKDSALKLQLPPVQDRDGVVDFLLRCPPEATIDRLKTTLIEKMFQLERNRRAIYLLLLESLDNDSLAEVSAKDAFVDVSRDADAKGLWVLIGKSHAPNLELEIYRLEKILGDMTMGEIQLPVYYKQFKDAYSAALSVGSKMTIGKVVLLFLLSLADSPLPSVANDIMDRTHLGNYPTDLEAAKTLLTPAWSRIEGERTSQKALLAKAPVLSSLTPPQCGCRVCPAHQGHGFKLSATPANVPPAPAPLECPCCGKPRHGADNCWVLKAMKEAGIVENFIRENGIRRPRKGNNQKIYSYTTSLPSVANRLLSLDTGSNIHLFNSRDLFMSMTNCREEVVGVSGGGVQLKKKGPTQFGDAYYYPDCPTNLLSLRVAVANGFEIELDKKGRWATLLSPDGAVFDFVLGSEGLLVCDLSRTSRVALHSKHFTVEQRKRAEMVKQLHLDLNHPSDDQMCQLLNSTCFLDTPLTAKDIRVSAGINGPCPDCLIGKFPTSPSLPSQSLPASAPGEYFTPILRTSSKEKSISSRI